MTPLHAQHGCSTVAGLVLADDAATEELALFDEIVHADWSKSPSKRWASRAKRMPSGWTVTRPQRVGPSDLFLEEMIRLSGSHRILAGFDFPIGLPLNYGRMTGLSGFREVLQSAGRVAGWERFFDVSELPSDIALARPFYPRTATQGVSRASLWSGLGVESFTDLLRECERGGQGRREACSIFWTLGGNQVGRAAAAGWQEIIRPALEKGARLWPFDGNLRTLSDNFGLVLAETYPADAYAIVGAPFGSRESKTSQADRRSKAEPILSWAEAKRVDLRDAEPALRDGFGASRAGEDPFDALLGLLAMIAVVDGDMPEASATLELDRAAWEGWILGR